MDKAVYLIFVKSKVSLRLRKVFMPFWFAGFRYCEMIPAMFAQEFCRYMIHISLETALYSNICVRMLTRKLNKREIHGLAFAVTFVLSF